MKKLLAMVLAFSMILVLCACGSQAAPINETVEAETTEEEQNLTPLEYEYIFDILYDDIEENGVPISVVDEIKLSLLDENNNYTCSFSILGNEASYIINGLTGEIVERNIPEVEIDYRDYSRDASTICLNYIGYKSGSIDNGKGKLTKQDTGMTEYTYSFDFNGKRYNFKVTFLPGYDVYTDEVIRLSSPVRKSSESDIDNTNSTPLDISYLIDVVSKALEDSGVSEGLSSAENISTVSQDSEGNTMFKFKLGGIDCWYKLDTYTGDIIDWDVPDEAIAAVRDYVGETIAEVREKLEVDGNLDNIAAKKTTGPNGEVCINIQFDYNGERYNYDKTFETVQLKEDKPDEELQSEAKTAVESIKGECVNPVYTIDKGEKLTFVKVEYECEGQNAVCAYVPEAKAIIEENIES